jgi:aminopeptidase-like protein
VTDAEWGERMYRWAADLFPICRSLTGPGVRQTLDYLGDLLPGLKQEAVASGTQAFDWTIPDEWTIRDAYIEDEGGNHIVDFKNSNLHVVGYSEPVDGWFELAELEPHLHSIPAMPDAIPYVTSYYRRYWGFCLTDRQRKTLKPGRYRCVIDSDLQPGVMNYGELILPGSDRREILLSTNICHPSLGNNELSGPVVSAALAQYLAQMPGRRFTYRILFLPETIGSIAYLSRNLEVMKRNTIAGFVVVCCGDDRAYSYLESPTGDSLADRAARHVMRRHYPEHKRYSYLDRGSDERQYCSPGVDLPVASIMRSRYACYPEYHTSLDDLSVISPSGLAGGFAAHRRAIEAIEANRTYRTTVLCEPQLGRRGMYGWLSKDGKNRTDSAVIQNVLSYSNGQRDLLAIADHIGIDIAECAAIAERLAAADLLTAVTDQQ